MAASLGNELGHLIWLRKISGNMNDLLVKTAALRYNFTSGGRWITLQGALAILSLLLLSFVTIDYIRVLRLRRKLPPGPFPLPLFGNFFQIPKLKPWIAFEQWAKHYNDPLTTVWIGRSPSIICNDAWVASDLMEKRASIYSSRPRIIVMGDMMNQTETNQVCQVYGDTWRVHRKLTVSMLLCFVDRN
jgi:hypothetical protein